MGGSSSDSDSEKNKQTQNKTKQNKTKPKMDIFKNQGTTGKKQRGKTDFFSNVRKKMEVDIFTK